MLRFLRNLFHQHRWEVFWYRGDVWTRCGKCGEWRKVLPDDLSEAPDGVLMRLPIIRK